MTSSPPSSIDPDEVARFSAQAREWWNPHGPFRPLHKFNPVRLGYIRDQIGAHFGRAGQNPLPFRGLRMLDIGCGGGLVCEPMARLGAQITGVDASAENIAAAHAHALAQRLGVDYRHGSAEALVEEEDRFDVILNLEVIEHAADQNLFLAACAQLLKPGGLMVMASLNRTLKSYALAILGAEYLLQWLPRGTHDWNKFISPDELAAKLEGLGLRVVARTGVSYRILNDRWVLSADQEVNYMLSAAKSPA